MLSSEDIEYQADCAAQFIGEYLLKWGRVPVRDYKEKYGTVRVYCSLGWHHLHDIFYSGHAYSRFPRWLWLFDLRYGPKVLKYSGLSHLSFVFHKALYRRAYKLAIKKYPEIRENILVTADWKEFLEGL